MEELCGMSLWCFRFLKGAISYIFSRFGNMVTLENIEHASALHGIGVLISARLGEVGICASGRTEKLWIQYIFDIDFHILYWQLRNKNLLFFIILSMAYYRPTHALFSNLVVLVTLDQMPFLTSIKLWKIFIYLFIMSYLPRITPSVHITVLPGAPALHAWQTNMNQ